MALDRDLADALAQPLGVALDRVDPLERGGQLGARGLQLAAVLGAGGRGLGALAVDPLERGLQLRGAGLGVAGALGAQALELGLRATRGRPRRPRGRRPRAR